ncbi:phage holin family protein [Delftia sp. PS-11]|uniref:phage holin family protein n=1 Tax=Delftia sp. PS-11 TaxID=2767222 RepID=UPI002455A8DF|nr:phage holin family protein [Delftia sp. PS-11]
MNWISLLGLDALAARWRAAAIELAIAAEDRTDLARLEWAQHKRSLQTMLVLLVAVGGLGVVVLLMLSVAVLVQFWDSPYRALAAWGLGGLWLALWGLLVWQLVVTMRRLSRPFLLTRNELIQDWQSIKRKL